MTQNEKNLLLKDLCARLPYGVKVDVINEDNEHHIVKISEGNIGHLGKGFWIECKPYLFPLSSMTEKQKMELVATQTYVSLNKNTEYLLFDWLNLNHFDYRGLIEKGLANDATGLSIY